MFFCGYKKRQNPQNPQKGQTLVVIVFLMIAALAIGVSLSNRFITTLSITSDSYTSYQAHAVAEAAIERILTLSTVELEEFILHNSCGSYCNLEILGPDGVVQRATVVLSHLGRGSEPFETRISVSDISEINLNGYGDNKTLSICWNAPQTGELPAIYATLVKGAQGSYTAENLAYNSIGSLRPNGFTQAISAMGFENCMSFNTGVNPRVIRIRSIYNETYITVIPDASSTLPSQGVLIESTGQVLDLSKKVSVIKSDNMVPLDFDYVLYQRSETEPLSN